MPLTLQKSIRDVSREELEAHIQEVQALRMSAAMEFVAGKNLRLQNSIDKVERKLGREYEMLEKEILKLDALVEKIKERMVMVETYKQEIGLITDTIIVSDDDEVEE